MKRAVVVHSQLGPSSDSESSPEKSNAKIAAPTATAAAATYHFLAFILSFMWVVSNQYWALGNPAASRSAQIGTLEYFRWSFFKTVIDAFPLKSGRDSASSCASRQATRTASSSLLNNYHPGSLRFEAPSRSKKNRFIVPVSRTSKRPCQ